MSYGKLNSEDVVLSSEIVSVPIWSNGTATLDSSSFVVDPSQSVKSALYYLDIVGSLGNPVQFSIAYANSSSLGTDIEAPSRIIYGQYRSLVLGSEDAKFEFNPGTESVNFWAISVDRARYKESLIPGSLELQFNNGTSDIKLVDGGAREGETVQYKDSGRVYNLYASGSSDSYGYFLPDIGTILLDVTKSGITPGANPNMALRNAFTASNCHFTVQSQETVSSNFVFVRAKNSEFNYSMNPTFVNSNGELNSNLAANSPETFVTSVGLYNDANELLAIAKLSRPLAKNFTKEALIRVKLDY